MDEESDEELLKAWEDAAPKVGQVVEIIWPGHWSDGLLAVVYEVKGWGVKANILNAPDEPWVHRVLDGGDVPTRLDWEQFVIIKVDGPL